MEYLPKIVNKKGKISKIDLFPNMPGINMNMYSSYQRVKGLA